ncbi:MAG TPA: putative Ig domain-containing protein [Gammaproteobacteria bacterium]|nr:putative Ig domain-containing protein [Gammaproteobacteria bacterium]
MLAACGDEASDAPAGSTGTSSGYTPVSGGTTGGSKQNRAPQISGIPPGMVVADSAYSFTPRASDPDGDALTFAVVGRPYWASFSRTTGKLTGRPGSGDIGSTYHVEISVSDGRARASTAVFRIHVVATAYGAATLSWQPPTERADGSPLTDLAGYKVYWSTSPDDFLNSVTISNPGLTSHMIEQLTPATWYFAATAFDSAGFESRLSNIASKVIGD